MYSSNSKWPGQSFVLFMAWAYLAFVVYGSLVPLDFHPELAQQRYLMFLDPAQFSWSLQSKADIVTNIVLTMPLVFLWSALITAGGQRNNVFGVLLVLIGSVCVSFFVEWAQIFFLPRDPSLVDVLAQVIGSSLSAVLWLIWGRAFITWLAEFPVLSTVPSLSFRLLILYAIGLFAYGLVPLDLTLSLTDFYRKFRDGKVLLFPFMHWGSLNPELLYGFITDIALWVPIGLLGRLAFPRPKVVILSGAIFAAILLEFFQLFVLSRVSDSTQVIAAAIGALIGITIARYFSSQKEIATNKHFSPAALRTQTLTAWGAAIGWMFILCLVFWYPYNFQITQNASFARDVLGGIPLEELFYQSELRAVTELLRKTLFFAPLGLFLAWALHRLPSFFPKKLVTALFVLLAAGLIEAGKFFLPGKFPSGTNMAMEFVGGFIGYWFFNAWQGWQTKSSSNNAFKTPQQAIVKDSTFKDRPAITNNKSMQYAWLGLATFALGTFLWIATKIPQVPYNFRNLPNPGYPYFSMVLIGAALIWCAGFPFTIARKLAVDKKAALNYPVWLITYGAIAWILIFIAVEPVRAYKIVGSPILHWAWHFEWLLRFLALMAAVGTFAVLGCIVGGQKNYLSLRLSLWSLHAIWLLPLLYWSIIAQAATDNIVELLAWGANPASAVLIFLVITNVFFAASKLRNLFLSPHAKEKITALVSIIFSFPIGYYLLWAATEPVIVKYEKVFSGIQFILSSDRQNYAQPVALIIRYFMLHLFLIIVTTFARWLFVDNSFKNQIAREK